MNRISITDQIKVPTEKVWKLLTDFSAQSRWMEGVKRVKITSSHHKGIGVTIYNVCQISGFELECEAKITEWTENQRLAYRATTTRGFRWKSLLTLEPSEAGTKLSSIVDYELPGLIFGKIFGKLMIKKNMERMLRTSLKNARTLLEASNTRDLDNSATRINNPAMASYPQVALR